MSSSLTDTWCGCDVTVCAQVKLSWQRRVSIQFNSVYFIQPNITNYVFASVGFTICTHTTSLTFDLTLDQEKLSKKRKSLFTGKKGKKPSGEQQRRIPLRDGRMQ